MIVSFGVLATCFILFFLYNQFFELKQIMKRPKSVIVSLYDQHFNFQSQMTLIKFYLPLFTIIIFVTALAKLLNLNNVYTILFVLIQISFIPLILLFNMSYLKSMSEYRNLTTYLTQFILVFKSFGKVMQTLEQLDQTLDTKTNDVISTMIDQLKSGESLKTAFNIHIKMYPHFIVNNLYALVENIEKYGTHNYFDALNLIQDDIDDWLDDLDEYYTQKKQVVYKINTLIIFAFVIALIAMRMLFSVSLSTNTNLYQSVIFSFCLIEYFTYVFGQYYLQGDFIDESEIV